jgi:AhpD family alkylhydroperoxidase
MDIQDKDKIEKIIHDGKLANGYFLRNSDVFRAFADMEAKAFADGSISRMHKELTAVGISVVIDCESCMQWHIGQALQAGATEEQVVEAVGVGIGFEGGPATVSARFAMKVLEYYREQNK